LTTGRADHRERIRFHGNSAFVQAMRIKIVPESGKCDPIEGYRPPPAMRRGRGGGVRSGPGERRVGQLWGVAKPFVG